MQQCGYPSWLGCGRLRYLRWRAQQEIPLLFTLSAVHPAPLLCRQLATEPDGHSQRDRSQRYFGAPTLRAERSAQLKRWRRSLQEGAAAAAAAGGGGDGSATLGLLALRKVLVQQVQQAQQQGRLLDLPSPSFLPLELEEEADGPPCAVPAGPAGPAAMSAAAELAAEQAAVRRRQGETNEELLLRRTREFNEATRERPHDIQLWLRFARFQVRCVCCGGRAGCRFGINQPGPWRVWGTARDAAPLKLERCSTHEEPPNHLETAPSLNPNSHHTPPNLHRMKR